MSDSCIIVTACHGKDSPEVDIARQYRDKFMSPEEIRGYYIIAEKTVPIMNANKAIKQAIKEGLVDKLIEYGKFKLGMEEKCSLNAKNITLDFLHDCRTIYVRQNGKEV